MLKASKYSCIKSSRFILRFLLNERDEDDEADDDEVDDDEEAADDDDEDFKKFFKFRLHKNSTTKFMSTITKPMPDMMPARTVVLNLKSLLLIVK